MPLQAIAGLLGVPEEDREKLFDWTNQMIGGDDPEFAEYNSLAAVGELIGYAMELATMRKEKPGEDIVSTLIDSEADGQLTEAEFGMFVVTLTVAGNETSRNSITQGMMAFTDFPDQWELFKAQRPKTAADEIIRWASPITAFQRTALADTELSGVQIKKGQRLVLFYRSANFDEDVFDDPYLVQHPARPQPAPGLRRNRSALLRRRQPRADDHRFDVQRDRRPSARPPADVDARPAAVELHQRHQALAGATTGPLSRRDSAPIAAARLAFPQHAVARGDALLNQRAFENLVRRGLRQLIVDSHVARPRLR